MASGQSDDLPPEQVHYNPRNERLASAANRDMTLVRTSFEKLALIGLVWFTFLSTTFGQTQSIPPTPFEARIWIKNSSNSFKENELGQVTSVTIDYVPRVFVIGDLEVFPHLEELRINYTGRFYDRHMSGIARLKKLKKLSVRSCDELTEATLDVLRYLPDLRELSLTEVDGIFSLEPLALCKSLTTLTFSSNGHFDFLGLDCLRDMSQLKKLDLSYNKTLEDKHLRHLAHCGSLESLNLKGCLEVTDDGLSVLDSMTKLKTLNLARCKRVQGAFLENLSSTIRELTLSGCDLDDANAASFVRFDRLENLHLDGNKRLTESAFEGLKACQALEVLDLAGLPVTGEHLRLMASFSNLKSLDLSRCQDATGEDIAQLRRCRGLETLRLSHCRRIDSPDILPLTAFANLKSLSLDGTRIKLAGIES